MGIFSVPIEVSSLEVHAFTELDATVDTGAVATMIPRSILDSLGIAPETREVFTLADGSRVELDMAQVRARVEDRETITWVIFGSDDSRPLLGAYTLEGVFLGVDPSNRRLIPVERLLL